MEPDIKEISARNLVELRNRLAKFKIKRTDQDVKLAMDSLPFYHCVRDSNIIEVIKSQSIKVKNQVVKGEHTNMSTDFFQGFENNISMSIGEPWVEYGQYAFSFGAEHISPNSLFFSQDPWLWGTNKFERNVLAKDDFLAYAHDLMARNLMRISKKIYIQLPWKSNLHRLAARNFRRWELKQLGNLSILDADEFYVWSNFDKGIYIFVRAFGNTGVMLMFFCLLILLIVVRELA